MCSCYNIYTHISPLQVASLLTTMGGIPEHSSNITGVLCDYDDLANSTTNNNCSSGEVVTGNVNDHQLIAVAVINVFIVILPCLCPWVDCNFTAS